MEAATDDPALGLTTDAFIQRYSNDPPPSPYVFILQNWPIPVQTGRRPARLPDRHASMFTEQPLHIHTVVSDVAATASLIFHISNRDHFFKLRFLPPPGECTYSGVLV